MIQGAFMPMTRSGLRRLFAMSVSLAALATAAHAAGSYVKTAEGIEHGE